MYLIELTIAFYFSYVSLYSFILSLGGLFYRNAIPGKSETFRKFAVLIPAYKEDKVITHVARHALRQDYPSDSFDVIVIADSLQERTLTELRSFPIHVVEVSFEKSTKVKALNRAMEVLGDQYDCAVVLDADNLMAPGFLSKMNDLYNAGYKAVQGRRDPKNENTSMALLDGLSETINNFIYRQGTVALGMSASLNGSGMMFDYTSYKKIMAAMDSIGGFDRELELKLLEQGIKVHFAGNVIVYDEKVTDTSVFEKQRKRWISSQFFYLKKYFLAGWMHLFKGNFSFFNSAVLRNIQLPRLLNLGLLSLVLAGSIILERYLNISPLFWSALLLMNVLAILFAIPSRFYAFRYFKSVLLVPSIFFRMFMLLFKLKDANKTFIHTPHGHIETQPTNTEKVI